MKGSDDMGGIIYVISGINGQLGRCIAEKLRGERVRGLVLPRDDSPSPKCAEIIRGDVCDKESLRPLFKKEADEEIIFIHSAGLISISSEESSTVRKVNASGTRNVTELCKEYNVKRLIYISSVHAFSGEGLITEESELSAEKAVGSYAKSKAEATETVLSAASRGLDALVLFPSGMIGPGGNGEGQMDKLIRTYAELKLPFSVDGGYDFTDIRDVAEAVISSSKYGRSGEKYILSGHYASIRYISDYVRSLLDRRPCIISSPRWLSKALAPGVESLCKKLDKPVLMTPYSVFTLFSNAEFSYEKARIELGYNPRPLEDSIRDTLRWLYHRDLLTGHRKIKLSISAI